MRPAISGLRKIFNQGLNMKIINTLLNLLNPAYYTALYRLLTTGSPYKRARIPAYRKSIIVDGRGELLQRPIPLSKAS
jgi:hypothetical protein